MILTPADAVSNLEIGQDDEDILNEVSDLQPAKILSPTQSYQSAYFEQ
jgi:hypothetical protein